MRSVIFTYFQIVTHKILAIVPEMIKINIPYNKTQPLIWCPLEDLTLIWVFLTKFKINLEEGNITQIQIKISYILFLTLNYNLDLLWSVDHIHFHHKLLKCLRKTQEEEKTPGTAAV